MAKRGLGDAGTAAEITAAVKKVEGQTAAEVVVSIRSISGDYRFFDCMVGFGVALAGLLPLVFLQASQTLPLTVFLAVVSIGFVGGAFFTYVAKPLRRLLAGPSLCEENVRRSARAAFYDLTISKTKGRYGLLVYVSQFEKLVEVTTDLAIDTVALGSAWNECVSALKTAVADDDGDRFIAAVGALGPVLAKAHPVRADDENELPDEVVHSRR